MPEGESTYDLFMSQLPGHQPEAPPPSDLPPVARGSLYSRMMTAPGVSTAFDDPRFALKDRVENYLAHKVNEKAFPDAVDADLKNRFGLDDESRKGIVGGYARDLKMNDARRAAAGKNEVKEPKRSFFDRATSFAMSPVVSVGRAVLGDAGFLSKVPYLGSAVGEVQASDYRRAKERVESLKANENRGGGDAIQSDYDIVAAYEAKQDREASRSTLESVAQMIAGTPAFVIENMTGMGIAKGAVGLARGLATTANVATKPGVRHGLAAASSRLGQLGLGGVATPSMYAVQAEEAAAADPSLPIAQAYAAKAAYAGLQNMILGKFTGKFNIQSLPGKVAGGMVEQQALDIGASGLDDLTKLATGRALGMDTKYGNAGNLARGLRTGKMEDFWDHLIVEAATFGTFGAMHRVGNNAAAPEKSNAGPWDMNKAFVQALDAYKSKGLSAEAAARKTVEATKSVNDQLKDGVPPADIKAPETADKTGKQLVEDLKTTLIEPSVRQQEAEAAKPAAPAAESNYVPLAEAAKAMGVTEEALLQRAAAGEITAVQQGEDVMVPRSLLPKPTPPTAPVDLKPTTPPETPPVASTPDKTGWMDSFTDAHFAQAKGLGIVEAIEKMAADGLVGKQIERQLSQSVPGVDRNDVGAMVASVRNKLGIPSQMDFKEFAAWRDKYLASKAAPETPPVASESVRPPETVQPPIATETANTAVPAATPTPQPAVGVRSTHPAVEAVRSVADRALSDPARGLPAETQKVFREATYAAIDAIPEAHRPALAAVKDIVYLPTREKLTEFARDNAANKTERKHYEAMIARGDAIGGQWNKVTGRMLLDGDTVRPDGTKRTAAQVHAHEFTHVLEGRNYKYSGTPEWTDIFNSGEFTEANLGKYALQIPKSGPPGKEAFAEFGRLVYADKVSEAELSKQFPEATKFWKKNGLLPETNTAKYAKPEQVFKGPAIDIGNEHIDPALPPTPKKKYGPGKAQQAELQADREAFIRERHAMGESFREIAANPDMPGPKITYGRVQQLAKGVGLNEAVREPVMQDERLAAVERHLEKMGDVDPTTRREVMKAQTDVVDPDGKKVAYSDKAEEKYGLQDAADIVAKKIEDARDVAKAEGRELTKEETAAIWAMHLESANKQTAAAKAAKKLAKAGIPEGVDPETLSESERMLYDKIMKNVLPPQSTGMIADFAASTGRSIGEVISTGAEAVRMEVRKLAGQIAPATTKIDRQAGETVGRFAAAPMYGRSLAARLIDKVMGDDLKRDTPDGRQVTAADRVRVGAVIVELRLRHMRDLFLGRRTMHDVEAARIEMTVKMMPPSKGRDQLERLAKKERIKAKRAEKDAKGVRTIIGQVLPGEDPYGNPMMYRTEADFRSALADPLIRDAINRYQEHVVPIIEDNYRRSQGLDPGDVIGGETQLPGLPINLKAFRPGDEARGGVVSFPGENVGELRNPKLRKYKFANEAKGNAKGYYLDIGDIITDTVTHGAKVAAQAEMYRTLVDKGIAKWASPDQQVTFGGERGVVFRDVNPPKKTQEASPEQKNLVVDPKVAGEIRQALNADKPSEVPILSSINGAFTKIALASTTEAVYHAKNLFTFLWKPGVNPLLAVRNAHRVLRNDAETQDRIIELARIGAFKESGFGSGMLIPESKKESVLGKFRGRTIRAKHLDPTYYLGEFVHTLDKTMRLTASDAFDNLERRGLVVGDQTNKRDFINQLGQYNKAVQSKAVKLLRDTGFGPFATAATNYYMQGLRAMTGSTGLKSTSRAAAIQLRATYLARILSTAGVAAVFNYLVNGRVDGDDDTPLGAIKIGEKGGKIRYFDLLAFTGMTRGMRETGTLALAEGLRHGESRGNIADHAAHDVLHSAIHPVSGPAVATGYMMATGKNTLGNQVADTKSTATTPTGIKKAAAMGKPSNEDSQFWLNVQAALWNLNPTVANVSGKNKPPVHNEPGKKPKETASAEERIWSLLGPFGAKFRVKHAEKDKKK